MSEQKTGMIVMNFLIAITLIPLGVELFGQTGKILLGERIVALHPWLPTFYSYIPILALLLLYLRATLDPFSRFGFRKNTEFWKFSVGIGILSALVIFAMDVFFGILDSFGVPADPTVAVGVGFLLAFGVLVPFTEELLFRGVIQTVFTERIKSKAFIHPAVWIASGFEVLMHLSVPLYFAPSGQMLSAVIGTVPQLLYVALFGAIGGWVYSRTQSLLGPILIHAIGNAGELLLFWFFV